MFLTYVYRLGKLACPRVNDDHKIDVDDQKLSSGRPHDDWTSGCIFYKLLLNIIDFSLLFTALQKKYT